MCTTKRLLSWTILVLVLCLGLYFCAYFLSAQYVDVGDNAPHYLVRYRIGSHSLQRFATLFEPARVIDDTLLRRRHADVFDFQLGGRKDSVILHNAHNKYVDSPHVSFCIFFTPSACPE